MERLTGLRITGSATAVLQLGDLEGACVDIDGTKLRLIREGGKTNIVEIDGSGGRVISRATADQSQ